MEAASVSCPNCGAGLGPPQAGVCLCAYCGHHSVAAVLTFDEARRAATLAAALAEFETRRAQRAGKAEDLRRRQREALARGRRVNGFLMLGIGGLFLLFFVACLALMAVAEAGLGVGAFGLFWLALGGLLVYIGLRYLKSDRREQQLREHGLRGRAVVSSFKETRLVVDGAPRYELSLRVELPDRAPYQVRQSDNVQKAGVLETGADLPVLVNPRDPTDVLIDWFAA